MEQPIVGVDDIKGGFVSRCLYENVIKTSRRRSPSAAAPSPTHTCATEKSFIDNLASAIS